MKEEIEISSFNPIKQIDRFKKFNCKYYMLFFNNQNKVDVVFKIKSRKEKQWFYLRSGDYKLVYDLDEKCLAFINIDYDINKAEKVQKIKLVKCKHLITETGIVLNRTTSNVIKFYKSFNAYIRASIYYKGISKIFSIHRLVAHAFCPRPDHLKDMSYDDLVVNHIDGNKINNNYTNLEWCTPSENTQHAIKNGLINIKGENNPSSIYSDLQVKIFRKTFYDKKITVPNFAKQHGCSESLMRGILYNLIRYDVEYKPDLEYIKSCNQKGELSKTAILTWDLVKEIRDDFVINKYPYTYYSTKYNTSKKCIEHLLQNTTWVDKNYIIPDKRPRQKIKFETVLKIRKHFCDNDRKVPYIYYSKLYKINNATVSKIMLNKIWIDKSYNPPISKKA
jgi:hypothetical protein